MASYVRKFTVLVAMLVLALGATACGGDDGGDSTVASGIDVFKDAGCGNCHTFSAADANGPVGPNLDNLDLTVERVSEQVTNGGGGMPPFSGKLSEAEIQAVSEFVANGGGSQ